MLSPMLASNDDNTVEMIPMIWISGESDKLGVITGINLSAASLFGYNKTELLNRKVSVLMPQLYSRHHESFLEDYIYNGESTPIVKNQ